MLFGISDDCIVSPDMIDPTDHLILENTLAMIESLYLSLNNRGLAFWYGK